MSLTIVQNHGHYKVYTSNEEFNKRFDLAISHFNKDKNFILYEQMKVGKMKITLSNHSALLEYSRGLSWAKYNMDYSTYTNEKYDEILNTLNSVIFQKRIIEYDVGDPTQFYIKFALSSAFYDAYISYVYIIDHGHRMVFIIDLIDLNLNFDWLSIDKQCREYVNRYRQFRTHITFSQTVGGVTKTFDHSSGGLYTDFTYKNVTNKNTIKYIYNKPGYVNPGYSYKGLLIKEVFN